jgi:hypothetical protein
VSGRPGRSPAWSSAGCRGSEDAPREDDDPTARPQAVSTVRSKPYRRSVDLPPARHFALDAWTAEASQQLGQHITGRAVMNVLVERLLTDATLAGEIMRDPELIDLSRRTGK